MGMRVHTLLLRVISSSTFLQVRSLTENIPVILDALRTTSTLVEVQVSYEFSTSLVIQSANTPLSFDGEFLFHGGGLSCHFRYFAIWSKFVEINLSKRILKKGN